MLEGQEDACICSFLGTHFQNVLSVENDFAFSNLIGRVAHDNIAQCGLTCTVGTHHGMYLAIVDSEVYAFQYFFAIDSGMQIAYF